MQVAARTDQANIVALGDHIVEGWLTRPQCPGCGGPRVYFLAFEATCCPSCNVWLELLCPEPDCIHCQCRPERPLPSSG